MFVVNGRLKVTLCFLIIALMLGFQSHHLSNADTDSSNGIRVSTFADGWYEKSTVYKGQYVHTAWADFTAVLSAKGRDIGDSEDGNMKLSAFLAGGYINPGDIDRDFTLTIWGWWIFKFNDSVMEHHYDKAQTSSPSPPYGWAKSSGDCGGVTPKAESWP